jgi:hypothetical protein
MSAVLARVRNAGRRRKYFAMMSDQLIRKYPVSRVTEKSADDSFFYLYYI